MAFVTMRPSKKKSNSISRSAKPARNAGLVSLKELAKRCGISQHAARLRLNKAGYKRPGTRWKFKAGSRELARAAKLLQQVLWTRA